MTQLAWNADSEFLAAVVVAAGEEGGNGAMHEQQQQQQLLQLWHRSNWRWYLKQQRSYHGAAALRCCWDAAAPLHLHVLTSGGGYQRVRGRAVDAPCYHASSLAFPIFAPRPRPPSAPHTQHLPSWISAASAPSARAARWRWWMAASCC